MLFLVVGSNSFSGSHFVDHLLCEGHEVVDVSRSEEFLDVFLPHKSNSAVNRFEFQMYDLNNDLDHLGLLSEGPVDVKS